MSSEKQCNFGDIPIDDTSETTISNTTVANIIEKGKDRYLKLECDVSDWTDDMIKGSRYIGNHLIYQECGNIVDFESGSCFATAIRIGDKVYDPQVNRGEGMGISEYMSVTGWAKNEMGLPYKINDVSDPYHPKNPKNKTKSLLERIFGRN
jgi:hypothetical protein